MRALLSLSVVALLTLVPAGLASEHGAAGPDDHVRVVAEADAVDKHYYVLEDHGAFLVFEETNGVVANGVPAYPGGAATGVQPAWFCLLDDGAIAYVYEDEDCLDGVKTAPDAQVTNAGLIHEIEELLPGPLRDIVHEIEEIIDETLP